jgi:hypothetical protein
MPATPKIRIARSVLALALLAAAIYWGTDDELPMDAGTVVLALVAAYFAAFSKTTRSAVVAATFLVLVPVVQNAVDVYFDFGVQQRGLPWPWQSSKSAAVGSIQEHVGHVATTAFVILAIFAAAALASQIARLAKRTRSDA